MKSAQKGFTLVELLVVITIIAILSIIGITIFTSVQKGARDARRRADIDSVAKAMEINYGRFSTGNYSKFCQITSAPGYDCGQWFSGGLPKDPSSNVYHWCGTEDLVNNPVCSSASNPIGDNAPDGRPTWMVCATLEAGGKYCIRARQ